MLEYLVQDVAEHIKYEGKVDFMVHAASQAAPSYYGVDPVGTFKANTLGTINMLELAKEKKVEGILYFSTGSVYGDIPGEKVLVHPGYAKGKMINSILIANKFLKKLPKHEAPEKTQDYEGFFHVSNISGNRDRKSVV